MFLLYAIDRFHEHYTCQLRNYLNDVRHYIKNNQEIYIGDKYLQTIRPIDKSLLKLHVKVSWNETKDLLGKGDCKAKEELTVL